MEEELEVVNPVVEARPVELGSNEEDEPLIELLEVSTWEWELVTKDIAPTEDEGLADDVSPGIDVVTVVQEVSVVVLSAATEGVTLTVMLLME